MTYIILLILFVWLECVENASDIFEKDSTNELKTQKRFGRLEKKAMLCPSIAEQGEDVVLKKILNVMFSVEQNVTYLDIGCGHPFRGSNTYLFCRENSSGVIVDANPQYKEENLRLRPKDIFLNIGVVGRLDKKEMIFYPRRQIGTFVSERTKGWKMKEEISVPIMHINDLLKEYFSGRELDLMSVDVEGLDEEILMAIDYSIYRPKVIVMESSKVDLSYLQSGIIKFLDSKGYALVADTFINFIFADITKLKVRKEGFYTKHFKYNGKRL